MDEAGCMWRPAPPKQATSAHGAPPQSGPHPHVGGRPLVCLGGGEGGGVGGPCAGPEELKGPSAAEKLQPAGRPVGAPAVQRACGDGRRRRARAGVGLGSLGGGGPSCVGLQHDPVRGRGGSCGAGQAYPGGRAESPCTQRRGDGRMETAVTRACTLMCFTNLVAVAKAGQQVGSGCVGFSF
jgi:hypothetical protein